MRNVNIIIYIAWIMLNNNWTMHIQIYGHPLSVSDGRKDRRSLAVPTHVLAKLVLIYHKWNKLNLIILYYFTTNTDPSELIVPWPIHRLHNVTQEDKYNLTSFIHLRSQLSFMTILNITLMTFHAVVFQKKYKMYQPEATSANLYLYLL